MFVLWSILCHVWVPKRKRKCVVAKSWLMINTWTVSIFVFKNWHLGKKEVRTWKRTSIILFQGSSLIPENGPSVLHSKCVVLKLNSFQSKELPAAVRQHLTLEQEEASRRKAEESGKCTTETATDKTSSEPPLAHPEERPIPDRRAHWTAHIELLGGLTVLGVGSWL